MKKKLKLKGNNHNNVKNAVQSKYKRISQGFLVQNIFWVKLMVISIKYFFYHAKNEKLKGNNHNT